MRVTFSLKKAIEYLVYLYILVLMTSISTGTTGVKVIRVVLMGMLILFFLSALKGKIGKMFFLLWACAFFVFNIVNAQVAVDHSSALHATMTLFYVLIINIGICLYMDSFNISLGMCKAFLLGTLLEAVQTFGRHGILVYLFARSSEEGSANTLGFYAAISVVICYFFAKNKIGKPRYYKFLMALFIIIALLTASRKALIYIIIPIIIYTIITSKDSILAIRNIILGIAIVAISFYLLTRVSFLYNLVGWRIESMIAGFMGKSSDASTETRMRLISAGIEWFMKKPYIGYGLAGYKTLNMSLRGSKYYAHNNYIELLVDCGLVGTFIYYSLYIHILSKLKKISSISKKLFAISVGVIIALLVGDYGMVSYDLPIFQLVILVIYMNCSLALKPVKN